MRSRNLDLMILMYLFNLRYSMNYCELQEFLCNIVQLFRVQIVLFVAVLLKTQDFL